MNEGLGRQPARKRLIGTSGFISQHHHRCRSVAHHGLDDQLFATHLCQSAQRGYRTVEMIKQSEETSELRQAAERREVSVLHFSNHARDARVQTRHSGDVVAPAVQSDDVRAGAGVEGRMVPDATTRIEHSLAAKRQAEAGQEVETRAVD